MSNYGKTLCRSCLVWKAPDEFDYKGSPLRKRRCQNCHKIMKRKNENTENRRKRAKKRSDDVVGYTAIRSLVMDPKPSERWKRLTGKNRYHDYKDYNGPEGTYHAPN